MGEFEDTENTITLKYSVQYNTGVHYNTSMDTYVLADEVAIHMHKIIDDIISSTKKRIKAIRDIDTNHTINARSLPVSIRLAKEKNHIPVIAEVKPASPTTHNRDITPKEAAQIAIAMEKAGAVAISVLTEPNFFHGSIENLEHVRKAVNIPVLRKDFIIDKKQIYEVESDLILLIAGLLGSSLPDFIRLATQRGLQPLVEVHNEAELTAALAANADIIGINNRNLKTMEVDIKTTEILITMIKEPTIGSMYPDATGKTIISESGILTPQDAGRAMRAGVDAILVGTSIMKGDIYLNTRKLVETGISQS